MKYHRIPSLKYLRSTTLGCRDMRIIKSEFKAKSKFHGMFNFKMKKSTKYFIKSFIMY